MFYLSKEVNKNNLWAFDNYNEFQRKWNQQFIEKNEIDLLTNPLKGLFETNEWSTKVHTISIEIERSYYASYIK